MIKKNHRLKGGVRSDQNEKGNVVKGAEERGGTGKQKSVGERRTSETINRI